MRPSRSFLGIVLSLAFQKWKKTKEGFNASTIQGPASSVIQQINPGDPQLVNMVAALHRTTAGQPPEIMAIRVNSTPGKYANHAQIDVDQDEINHFTKARQGIYSFSARAWFDVNHVNPNAGPGTHINAGGATNIVYTSPRGTRYVFTTRYPFKK